MTTSPAGDAAPRTEEIVFVGELDISTYDDAMEKVDAAERSAPPLLVLDLSQLRFIDSTGVRLVLLADEQARTDGRRVAVRLGSGQARRVFTALGLTDRIDVLDRGAGGAVPASDRP